MRIGFDRREIGFDAVPQGLVLMQGALRDAFLPQMIPDELVRVEVRGVARQEVELEPPALRLHELGDEICAMGRMAVDHEEDRLAAAPQERLEEGPEGAGVQPAGEDLVPEAPQRAYRGDRVHRLPLATGPDDRRLPARRPGPAQRGIRADPTSSRKKIAAPRCLARRRSVG